MPNLRSLILAALSVVSMLGQTAQLPAPYTTQTPTLAQVAAAQAPAPSVVASPIAAVASSSFLAAGIDYNQSVHPNISALIAYAHPLATGLYEFTVLDITSKSVHPFTTAISTTTGLAQLLRSVGSAKIYIAGTIGVASGGTSTALSWSSGGFMTIPVGKLFLIPNIRMLAGSVTKQQMVAGLALGWGK